MSIIASPTLVFAIVVLCTACMARYAAGESAFTLGIRDSIMIAHSFKGEEFGPAQNLHGATYTVDVEFCADCLADNSNWVMDIGFASELVSEVLSKYNFKNLDDLFPDENTTTEFMCREIHQQLCKKLVAGDKHTADKNFTGGLRVKLFESHKAWAAYYGTVSSEK